MDPIHLLIIDANKTVRLALETRLSSIPDLEITASVGSLTEAQSALARVRPDVVLIEPKKLDGEGIALIQALTSRPQPPLVIVLTSYHDEDEEFAVSEMGIDCYLLKEIDSQALIDAIFSCRGSGDPPCLS
ncbi:MAG: response regulator transcription factor [Anaerolineae bacterium]|nr:response regulator transcription factor [Anaerolineae bacterium]